MVALWGWQYPSSFQPLQVPGSKGREIRENLTPTNFQEAKGGRSLCGQAWQRCLIPPQVQQRGWVPVTQDPRLATVSRQGRLHRCSRHTPWPSCLPSPLSVYSSQSGSNISRRFQDEPWENWGKDHQAHRTSHRHPELWIRVRSTQHPPTCGRSPDQP